MAGLAGCAVETAATTGTSDDLVTPSTPAEDEAVPSDAGAGVKVKVLRIVDSAIIPHVERGASRIHIVHGT